jgi:LPS sulfotransferase NodH
MTAKAGQIRFVLFGQGRTGSKLLVELLHSHPDIHCDGEVLNGFYWNRFSRRLLLPLWRYHPLPLFRRNARNSHSMAYGFKLFNDHIRWPHRVLSSLYGEGWRIIHRQRRDLVAQTISGEVARQTRRWHRHSGNTVAPTFITIDPNEFSADLQKRLTRSAQIEQLLADIPHLDITYEDDLADPADWEPLSVRLLDYLGTPVLPLTTRMVKTWEQPYSEMILNYAELMAAAQRLPSFARLV